MEPINADESKAYTHVTSYKNGRQFGSVISGLQLPMHANMLITALSDVLNDAPEQWADRIVITVE